MFSKNVFRNLPVSSYKYEDEINTETMWEFKQLNPVYHVFMAFLSLKGFDEEKLVPYVDEKFINHLIQRLDSCVEVERDCVKHILFQLLNKVAYLRGYILQGTINSLADYGRILINGGVKELLELFKIFMRHKLIKTSIIIKVSCKFINYIAIYHYYEYLYRY